MSYSTAMNYSTGCATDVTGSFEPTEALFAQGGKKPVEAEVSLRCPRCGAALAPFEVPRGEAQGCEACGGVWVDDRAFAALRQGMEDEVVGIADALDSAPHSRRAEGLAPVRCPICGRELTATEVSHVRLDFCAAHGTWFDHEDVDAIAHATRDASQGEPSEDAWVERVSRDLGVLPEGLVEALGTVIAVGEHKRRLRF